MIPSKPPVERTPVIEHPIVQVECQDMTMVRFKAEFFNIRIPVVITGHMEAAQWSGLEKLQDLR